MNKMFIVIGLAIIGVAKVIILKSTLVDIPAYERCVDSLSSMCGVEPLTYVAIGWAAAIGGFVIFILGLKMPTAGRISR
ncbi:hypothetical protein [Candidatus Nitrososphaera sp. FF02]|uniref:hypothetical protein n=1 Tax=Candidatus Nitrososphaera sp. FF02 TaxID=3398226 RepID=UPI0039E7D6CE